jgi:outer membrane protein assembly complex protein YaeT
MYATHGALGGAVSPARRFAAAVAGAMVCAAACFAQVPTGSPVPAGKAIVGDVIAQGNRSVPTQRIMGLIKTRPGSEYKADVVAEDVRRLYQETKAFANIRVTEQMREDGKVIVYFQFVELPSTIQEIVYQGARHIKQDDLETITGLRKGAPLNPIAVQLARQNLLRRYQEKGRMSATVDVVEGDKTGDTRVVFNITEGGIARVNGIDFAGNTFVSGARLRTQVNSSRSFLGWVGGVYNPTMADVDITKLEEYYRSFGFHDVHVSRELRWVSERDVRLIFHIHEGRQYTVDKVDIHGVPDYERAELLKFNTLKAGDKFNQHTIDTDRGKMKDYVGYTGRDDAIQEVVFYPQDKPGQVIVDYDVQERPPARVGQVQVIGNEVTKQNVIIRQVPLYPGQILTYPDLRLAERNLARLNIFETNPETGVRPTVTVLDPDSDSEFKDVLVTVQETHTGSLLFGVGVNSDAGLTGSIVLNERNFDILRPPTSIEDLLSGKAWRGAGQEFRIEAVPGTQLQRYSVSWREPFLFDSPYSLGISAYYNERSFNEDEEDRVGTRITVGRKLNKYWSTSGTLRVEDVGIHNVQPWEPIDYLSVVGDNFLVGLRGDIVRDTRDSYLRATEGSLIDLSFEEVLGDFSFPVFNAELNKYWTIYQRPDGSGRHVLAARSQVGISGSNTPVFERFYAGGFRSIRGFEFRGVGPAVNGFEIGGDFLFLNSLEYQIPIRANDGLYVVTFLDSGTVESSVEIKDYRVAAGVGLRIVVPMLGPMPIALDFGFPIVKGPQDRDQVFSFWVGFFH